MPTDRELLRDEAERALFDPYYMSVHVLKLGDSADEDESLQNRNETELRPIYEWFDQPRPARLTRHQRRYRLWSSPRFTAKSYVVRTYMTSRIIRNPNITIGYQSQEKNMAIEGVRLIRDWFETPELTRLFGDFKGTSWDPEKGLIVSQRTRKQSDPTLRAIGLDNPLQGKRVDMMVFDDMVGELNDSVEGLRKVEMRFEASLPLVKPGGEIIWICTRWNPFDMTSSGETVTGKTGILRQLELARDKGEPCRWETAGPRGFFGCYAVEGDEEFFPHAVPGEPLFPSVLPETMIQENREEMANPALFASQIMNDPISDDMRQFDSKDLQYFDAHTEDGKLNPILAGAVPFMAVDPSSARVVKVGDDTTFAVAFIKWSGKTFDVFLVDWLGGRWKTARVQDTFMSLYEKRKPRMIYPEVNTGGAWFIDPIRQKASEKGMFLPIQEVSASLHGTGKKTQRIKSMQPLYQQHSIWHDTKLKNSKGEMQL